MEDYAYVDYAEEAGLDVVDVGYDGPEYTDVSGFLPHALPEAGPVLVIRSPGELAEAEGRGDVGRGEFAACAQGFFDDYDLFVANVDVGCDPERIELSVLVCDMERGVLLLRELPDYREDAPADTVMRIAVAGRKSHHYYGEFEYPSGVAVAKADMLQGCWGTPDEVTSKGELATDVYAPGFFGDELDFSNAVLEFRDALGDAAGPLVAQSQADEYGVFRIPRVRDGIFRVSVAGLEGWATVAVCTEANEADYQLVDPCWRRPGTWRGLPTAGGKEALR